MKADKRLGQHFLRDPHVLREIVAIADPGRSAGVLEIGPGEGALTAFLAREGVPVVALEKDERAIAELGERLPGGDVNVVHGDALTADLAALLPPAVGGRLPVVVGNLPYNVGSAIYRRLLELRGKVARIVLMLQKEVAERIVATAGGRAYGIPSVTTAMTADAWIVLDVPPSAFAPRPKVSSSVILVELRDTPLVAGEELERFERFLQRAFQGRRKTLQNALDVAPEVLAAQGVDPQARAEQIAPEALLALFRSGVVEV
ncbi:MAG: ribosomal RNA small subunit methyltransferase A [Myxococcales bacterium]|nr:ribosomal RNA small subunit methyltransferase A [Myxococcales bacterium]